MILVIGGTSDALEIAAALYAVRPDVVVSTATPYGGQVSVGRFPGRVVSGRMDGEALRDFIRREGISCVVDVSHPYAENISRLAIDVCAELQVAYCRYERPEEAGSAEDVIECPDFIAAGQAAETLPGILFLTIGINHVAQVLSALSDPRRVRVRVLPQSETLRQLEELGLNADHIIAMKGPFSQAMNELQFRESGAAVLITKDSGSQGGTGEKLAAARQLGLKTILVGRPQIRYPNKFSRLDHLLDFIKSLPV